MDVFKLKVNVGNAQIELEGNGDLVHTIFQELRDTGLGLISPNTLKSYSTEESFVNTDIVSDVVGNTTYAEVAATTPEPNNDGLPALENIVLAGGPSKETEWLLIYAMYCSNEGTSLFTRDDVRNKYDETHRMTLPRSKNFARNFKSLVSDKYISAVNANSFRLENAGLVKAKSIIAGNEDNNGNKKNKSVTRKKGLISYTMVELDLSENQRSSVKLFWSNHAHTSNMDKAVLAAYWLKNEKQIEEFTPDYFFTILRTVGEGASFDLGAAIRNAKMNKSYFTSGAISGAYRINHIGEDQVAKLLTTGDSE